MRYRLRSMVAAAVLVTAGLQAPVRADPGDIKGQDVKGDKNKSANDGWSQAPVPREQSAAKDAPDPGGTSTKENATRPVPDAPASLGPGQDPYQPLDHRTPGPSGQNPASPSK